MTESSDKMWPTGEGNGKLLQSVRNILGSYKHTDWVWTCIPNLGAQWASFSPWGDEATQTGKSLKIHPVAFPFPLTEPPLL